MNANYIGIPSEAARFELLESVEFEAKMVQLPVFLSGAQRDRTSSVNGTLAPPGDAMLQSRSVGIVHTASPATPEVDVSPADLADLTHNSSDGASNVAASSTNSHQAMFAGRQVASPLPQGRSPRPLRLTFKTRSFIRRNLAEVVNFFANAVPPARAGLDNDAAMRNWLEAHKETDLTTAVRKWTDSFTQLGTSLSNFGLNVALQRMECSDDARGQAIMVLKKACAASLALRHRFRDFRRAPESEQLEAVGANAELPEILWDRLFLYPEEFADFRRLLHEIVSGLIDVEPRNDAAMDQQRGVGLPTVWKGDGRLSLGASDAIATSPPEPVQAEPTPLAGGISPAIAAPTTKPGTETSASPTALSWPLGPRKLNRPEAVVHMDETHVSLRGPFHVRMSDASTCLLDPTAAGVECLGTILNTSYRTTGLPAELAERALEYAVFKVPQGRYIALQWNGPRTGRVFSGMEVTPAEAAAEFVSDGLPVPPGLLAPHAEPLSPVGSAVTSGGSPPAETADDGHRADDAMNTKPASATVPPSAPPPEAPSPKSSVSQAEERVRNDKAKGKRINQRMNEMLQLDGSRLAWTAGRWADELHCSKSTVVGTSTWETILNTRAMREAEKLSNPNYQPEDRRRFNRKRSRNR